jgi:hypothetical protein
VIDNRGEVGKG